jgi:hypothetical protein
VRKDGFGAAFLVEVRGCRWLLGVSPGALGTRDYIVSEGT